ncbi:MAG: hypothetical protein GX552_02460 [Chloroflexi bacterium]|nr:hypothetical protein [Chloroflexota bacterium]
MPIHLYVSPAGSGKTHWALEQARQAAQQLRCMPVVCVPSALQARSCNRRLAAAGGTLGVRVLTFGQLYQACLDERGTAYAELSDPEQYHLLSVILRQASLQHYAPLRYKPGFVRILQSLIEELKAARIAPEALDSAVHGEPRLTELAAIYAAYQSMLAKVSAADRPGLGWLAVEALEADPTICRWPLLIVDGFDNLTAVQIDVLKALAPRVGEMFITLTGELDRPPRRLAHQRMLLTRDRIEKELGVRAEPLPSASGARVGPLGHLREGLFESHVTQVENDGAVWMIEAPDRAGEVREALRWLRARRIQDNVPPNELALLARDLTPYRATIRQVARELDMPIEIVGGMPLSTSPVITALLDLLRMMLPAGGDITDHALPRRLVIEAWRSPYFYWEAHHIKKGEPIGIAAGDAEELDTIARQTRVIGGLDQWNEALARLAALAAKDDSAAQYEEGEPTDSSLVGQRAAQLKGKFDRFVERLTPPASATYRGYVQWLETLIGDDPKERDPQGQDTSLRVVECVWRGNEDSVPSDLAALQAFKEVLRGLVRAEEVLDSHEEIPFIEFASELFGAVEASFFSLPLRTGRPSVLVADVVQARGVPFHSVALLGVAEGEFPASHAEDPFLRDEDRVHLRERHKLPVDDSTASAEAGFFYETISRPAHRLLLTRPRLADNGAPWEPSPYWHQVQRLVNVSPRTLTSDSVPDLDAVASIPELMARLGLEGVTALHNLRLEESLSGCDASRLERFQQSAAIFYTRFDRPQADLYDGDLSSLAPTFRARYGPAYVWSATSLEGYRTCPFFFFAGRVLKLEPREEPEEGITGQQLGNIYHHILENLYNSVEDPTNLEQLLAALPTVAAQVLDEAPAREGFRVNAWWQQTRDEIQERVKQTVIGLAEISDDYRPIAFEARFDGSTPLPLGGGELRLRGFIDRVDRGPDGLRIIDYKTAGPTYFTPRALEEGKKLQIALYALAARDVLGLGEPVDGFYWHVQQAKASGLQLGKFEGGIEAAMRCAGEWAWRTVCEAREGHFAPHPPDGGCPRYCPIAAFCWHYRPSFGG